jgi:hypothetical protein
MMGMLMIFVNTSVAKSAMVVLPPDATTPPGCLNRHFSEEKAGNFVLARSLLEISIVEEHCLLNW